MPLARNAVLEDLKAAFQGITQANGYNYDVKIVTRDLLTIMQLPGANAPAILILDDGKEIPKDTAGTQKMHEMRPSIEGHFYATEDLPIKFQSFIADLFRKIYQPPALTTGDGFYMIEIEDITYSPPWAMIKIRVSLTYWFDQTNP